MKFNFENHGVRYEEVGPFQLYIALVNTGTGMDLRSCLAISPEQAQEEVTKSGAVLVVIFLMTDALLVLQRMIEDPGLEQSLAYQLFNTGKGGIVI